MVQKTLTLQRKLIAAKRRESQISPKCFLFPPLDRCYNYINSWRVQIKKNLWKCQQNGKFGNGPKSKNSGTDFKMKFLTVQNENIPERSKTQNFWNGPECKVSEMVQNVKMFEWSRLKKRCHGPEWEFFGIFKNAILLELYRTLIF